MGCPNCGSCIPQPLVPPLSVKVHAVAFNREETTPRLLRMNEKLQQKAEATRERGRGDGDGAEPGAGGDPEIIGVGARPVALGINLHSCSPLPAPDALDGMAQLELLHKVRKPQHSRCTR